MAFRSWDSCLLPPSCLLPSCCSVADDGGEAEVAGAPAGGCGSEVTAKLVSAVAPTQTVDRASIDSTLRIVFPPCSALKKRVSERRIRIFRKAAYSLIVEEARPTEMGSGEVV